jgi:hypothetical protein
MVSPFRISGLDYGLQLSFTSAGALTMSPLRIAYGRRLDEPRPKEPGCGPWTRQMLWPVLLEESTVVPSARGITDPGGNASSQVGVFNIRREKK